MGDRMKNVRVVYMGTPEFSLKPLEVLIDKMNVVGVVTKPDAYVGRKKVLTKSPVRLLAEEHNIPVLTPQSIKTDYQSIIDLEPDMIVTCAYGKIIPKALIDYPKFGCINIHASLLPKYRGAAPIQWALINGEEETGITLMYMDEFMDTGDIIDSIRYKIKDDDDIETLHKELSSLGAVILDNNLENLISGNVKRIKQNDEEATIAKMIDREMEELNFCDEGKNIINKIRAFSPYPLTKTTLFNEEVKIVKAHFVKCGSEVNKVYQDKDSLGIGVVDGIIYIDMIKPIGKNIMPIKNYLNGKRVN